MMDPPNYMDINSLNVARMSTGQLDISANHDLSSALEVTDHLVLRGGMSIHLFTYGVGDVLPESTGFHRKCASCLGNGTRGYYTGECGPEEYTVMKCKLCNGDGAYRADESLTDCLKDGSFCHKDYHFGIEGMSVLIGNPRVFDPETQKELLPSWLYRYSRSIRAAIAESVSAKMDIVDKLLNFRLSSILFQQPMIDEGTHGEMLTVNEIRESSGLPPLEGANVTPVVWRAMQRHNASKIAPSFDTEVPLPRMMNTADGWNPIIQIKTGKNDIVFKSDPVEPMWGNDWKNAATMRVVVPIKMWLFGSMRLKPPLEFVSIPLPKIP